MTNLGPVAIEAGGNTPQLYSGHNAGASQAVLSGEPVGVLLGKLVQRLDGLLAKTPRGELIPVSSASTTTTCLWRDLRPVG